MKGNGIERDTLDGVITALEKVDDTCQNGRNGLQYADLRDALHYLQVLQKMQKAQPLEKSEWDELYNQPLTWDELKTMEGKPVWVEESADNGLWWTYWVIWEDENAVLPEKTYGTTWQAYRKERE